MEEKQQKQFKFQKTTATTKIFNLKERIRAVCGGTSASKTISIIIWCIDYAQEVSGELITIASESYPHLEGGAMLDFENIMRDRNYWVDGRWNKTKHTYTFETGTRIEFKSIDSYGKAHGPRRDILFINEAQNLSYPIAQQLILRTRKVVWLDWNPTTEFWFYTELNGKRDDLEFITLTYLDNEALDPVTRHEIELMRSNKYLWQVYGLGQLGEMEGKIYRDWQIIEKVPHTAKIELTGLDYGYTNDPTAIIDIYKHDNGYIWDEIAYAKGLSNKQIADIILAKPPVIHCPVVPDSAEPKSNDELKAYGITVIPAEKGPDSVVNGIQLVQAQRISITQRSVNLIKEYRNYMWQTDKDGKIINVPEHAFSHSMDAGRYAMTKILKKPVVKMVASPMPTGYYPELGI